MKKNYRRIPHFINAKFESSLTNNFQVAIVKKIRLSTLPFGFSNFNLSVSDDELHFIDGFIPNASNGAYSRRNINGYKIRHPELPKVNKT